MIFLRNSPKNSTLMPEVVSGIIGLLVFVLVLTDFSCREKQQHIAYGNNPVAGKYQQVNGLKMYYEIYGTGAPLVLIHGNGASIISMHEQISYFSKNYQVIAVDSRSHGKTVDDGDSLSYDQMATDLNVLLDSLHIDSTYIIGHSDGGIVGLIMAYRYPSKVKKLVAMSPNIRPDSAVLYPKDETQSKIDFTKYEDSVKAGFTSAKHTFKLLKLMNDYPHISAEELASIKAPVLIMTSDHDVILLSHIIEIFKAIPGAELSVLPGSTHNAHRKNATVFNETVNHFFQKNISKESH
ncbi:MAG: alpha/beta hydrolase [Ferruginibacter sp.]